MFEDPGAEVHQLLVESGEFYIYNGSCIYIDPPVYNLTMENLTLKMPVIHDACMSMYQLLDVCIQNIQLENQSDLQPATSK